MIKRTVKSLLRLLNGNYVVLEDLAYGQYERRTLLRRFYSLAQAKAFARNMMPRFQGRLVVSDGANLQPLYVYGRR